MMLRWRKNICIHPIYSRTVEHTIFCSLQSSFLCDASISPLITHDHCIRRWCVVSLATNWHDSATNRSYWDLHIFAYCCDQGDTLSDGSRVSAVILVGWKHKCQQIRHWGTYNVRGLMLRDIRQDSLFEVHCNCGWGCGRVLFSLLRGNIFKNF